MALFVLAFALALAAERPRGGSVRARPGSVLAIGVILAAASVFTFSLPGLAWFVFAVPIWLGSRTRRP